MIRLKVVELIGKRPFGCYMDKYGNRSGNILEIHICIHICYMEIEFMWI